MVNPPNSSITLALPSLVDAAGMARQHVARWLVSRDVSAVVARNVILIVSELVTNVVEHTASEPELEVTHRAGTVRIAVHDHDPAPPSLQSGNADGGFGLQIVEATASQWGWDLGDGTHDVKVVWAEINDAHSPGPSTNPRLAPNDQ